MLVRLFIVLLLGIFLSCQSQKAESPEVISELNSQLFCGSVPDTEAHFRYLKTLGVKSLISVDGAKPKEELAKKYDMRYIHIPYSYNEVPLEQQMKLIKAFQDLPKPVFLHCHHGKHRAPVGSAVILRNHFDKQAEDLVKQIEALGTSKSYSGLYKSVAELKQIPSEQWNKAKLNTYEDPGTVAESMATIDELWDRLRELNLKKERSHNLLLLKENFFELSRAEKDKSLQKKYIEIHDKFSALELSHLSNEETKNQKIFKEISGLCKSCHKSFRD